MTSSRQETVTGRCLYASASFAHLQCFMHVEFLKLLPRVQVKKISRMQCRLHWLTTKSVRASSIRDVLERCGCCSDTPEGSLA